MPICNLLHSKTYSPVLLATAVLVFSGMTQAAAVDSRLPFPGDGTSATFGTYQDATGTTRDAILMDGIPIALKYDDFWSYSAHVLDALQGAGFIPSSYGSYDFSTGTGGLDLILFTGAGGANNQNVGASGTLDFENPYPAPTGSGTKWSEGWWGQNDQDNNPATVEDDKGPVTVGNMLTYLQEFDPNNTTPVFFVDWNNQGAGDSLLANASVQIIDHVTGAVLHEWALDTNTQPGDGTYDPNAFTYNYGNISFLGDAAACAANPWDPLTGEGCAGVTDSGNDYTNLSHNKGSGKPDFIFFADTMDLSLFNANDLFVFHSSIGCPTGIGIDGIAGGQGCNNNGFEEGFVTGRIGIGHNDVPEPAVFGLLGLGLLSMGFARGLKRGNRRAG